MNFKIIIMGNDSDYAKLRKIERYAFRMFLMYKSNLIQQKYNNNDNTKSDNIDIVMNLLLRENLREKFLGLDFFIAF